MHQFKQAEYQFGKNLLQLFKQRAKQHPNIDQNFQDLVKSSQLKQDYLQIADRISLTKKNNTNSLIELLEEGKTTGKYGLRVDYLDDTNKSCEERLRVYIVQLNKYLKEVSDMSSNIWTAFKKIKDLHSSVLKGQKQSSNLKHTLEQIKSFKEDIQNNKYSVTKVGSSFIKSQTVPSFLASSKSEGAQKIQAEKSPKQVQQLKQKLISIYNAHAKDSKVEFAKKDISETEAEMVLQSIKKKFREYQSGKSQHEQLKKLSESKIGQKVETKDFLIICFTKVLQARKVEDLKRIEKQIISSTNKNQELQLKRSLQLYIQEYNGRKQQPSAVNVNPRPFQHEVPEQNKNESLKAKYESQQKDLAKLSKQNQQLLKQSKLFKDDITQMKQQLTRTLQNQSKLQLQVKRLQQQLQSYRQKFSYLDRSGVSFISQQAQLVNYQQAVYESPERRLEQQKVTGSPLQVNEFKDIASPSSQNKVALMLQCLKDYQKLQVKLRDEIKTLSAQKSRLSSQVIELRDHFAQFFSQIELYTRKIQHQQSKNQKLETQVRQQLFELRTLRQKLQTSHVAIAKQSPIVSEAIISQANYKNQLGEVQIQVENYKSKINTLESEKQVYQSSKSALLQKVKSLQQAVNSLSVEKEAHISQLKHKNILINQLSEAFIQKQKAYKDEISSLTTQKQALLQNIVNLQCEAHISNQSIPAKPKDEPQSYIQHFFIEQQLYKSQIAKQLNKINELLELKDQLQVFFINEKLYQHQIRQSQQKFQQLKESKADQIYHLQIKIAGLQTELSKKHIQPKSHKMQEEIPQLWSSQRQSLQSELVSLKQQVYYAKMYSFFNGQILYNRHKQRQNLMNIMLQKTGKQIQKTSLVYKLDFHSTVSFHSYLDGLEGILVIAETSKVIIGGFYEGVYGEFHLQKPGFIFSLTNNECYDLKAGKKAAFYDKFYLIIGNSQIRIRPDRKNTELFSNFGVSNSSFNARGHNVNDFLQQGSERSPKIVNFQIYHVIFTQASPPQPQPIDAAPK